ncbi:ABC transporter permease, partial [bacterium]|nr:ABC transporter permease [bacterium]
MTTEILDISWSHIALTTLLVLLTGICSVILKLKIEKELFVGTIRTFLQLILLGYVLKFVFDLNNPVLVIIIFSLMIYFA